MSTATTTKQAGYINHSLIVQGDTVVIYRPNHRSNMERAVLCEGFWTSGSQRTLMWSRLINPAAEVGKALGYFMDRKGCIVNFAAGMQAAGIRVLINKGEEEKEFVLASPICGAYWLFGLALAKKQWMNLSATLAKIEFSQRASVLEDTARFYQLFPAETRGELKLKQAVESIRTVEFIDVSWVDVG